MDAAEVKLDPNDAIDGAIIGRTIRDIHAGNFENMNNLAVVGGTFSIKADNNSPVVIGSETVTTLRDPNNNGATHELTDSGMVQQYLSSGMTIVSTVTHDIMG
jgi:hypothetical protein